MLIVLITGRMGSGKSEVLDCIRAKGYAAFQADEEAKRLLNPKNPHFSKIQANLPPDFLSKSEELDKESFAQKIFNNPDQLKQISDIIHPLVHKALQNFIQTQRKLHQKIIFYEMPLLSREKIISRFDQIVFVQSPENLSLERLKKRGFKEQDVYSRWKLQAQENDISDLIDYKIKNDQDSPALKDQVENLLIELNKKLEK